MAVSSGPFDSPKTGPFTEPGSGLGYSSKGGSDMASKAEDLQTLTTLNQGYLLAAEKSDVRWYSEHLTEDYRATNPDGSFVDKAGFLSRIGRPHNITNLRAPD